MVRRQPSVARWRCSPSAAGAAFLRPSDHIHSELCACGRAVARNKRSELAVIVLADLGCTLRPDTQVSVHVHTLTNSAAPSSLWH